MIFKKRYTSATCEKTEEQLVNKEYFMKEKKTKRVLAAFMAVLLLLLVSCSAAKNDKTAKAVAAIDGVAKEEAKERC